jgi:hypothetical protein
VLWLSDLLPSDVPRSRVVTFGYNANVVNEASRARLVDHAGDFAAMDCKYIRKQLKVLAFWLWLNRGGDTCFQGIAISETYHLDVP